ncbi:transposable element Tcb1 transposase [Trichonephila clavipes]|nr:transposable element Tcb1 transposase [Trichonephila clavipes]
MADCEVEGTIANPRSIPQRGQCPRRGKGETKEGTSELDRIRWDRKRGRRASAEQVPQRKPYVIKANREARLAFAKMYVRQPSEYWENVIFVEESKYNIFGSDSKQKVWRKLNTAMDVKNLRPTVKYGGGNQIVWG